MSCDNNYDQPFFLIKSEPVSSCLPVNYCNSKIPTKQVQPNIRDFYLNKPEQEWLDTGLLSHYNVGIRKDFLANSDNNQYFAQMPFWMINAHLQGVISGARRNSYNSSHFFITSIW